jgi:K+-transporting ATPase KdpF subunit
MDSMSHPEYLIGGIIAVFVTVYLVAALLFPERF